MSFGFATPKSDVGANLPEWTAAARKSYKPPTFFEMGSSGVEAAQLATTTTKSFTEIPQSLGVATEGFPNRLALEKPLAEGEEGSFRVPEGAETGVVETGIPKLVWPDEQDPILTDSVCRLLTALWAIVASRALQSGFPLRKTITISIFRDPTEHEHKAILPVACNASVVQALAFWDSLERDLQGWLQTLSQNDRTTFITKLGLRVHWR